MSPAKIKIGRWTNFSWSWRKTPKCQKSCHNDVFSSKFRSKFNFNFSSTEILFVLGPDVLLVTRTTTPSYLPQNSRSKNSYKFVEPIMNNYLNFSTELTWGRYRKAVCFVQSRCIIVRVHVRAWVWRTYISLISIYVWEWNRTNLHILNAQFEFLSSVSASQKVYRHDNNVSQVSFQFDALRFPCVCLHIC